MVSKTSAPVGGFNAGVPRAAQAFLAHAPVKERLFCNPSFPALLLSGPSGVQTPLGRSTGPHMAGVDPSQRTTTFVEIGARRAIIGGQALVSPMIGATDVVRCEESECVASAAPGGGFGSLVGGRETLHRGTPVAAQDLLDSGSEKQLQVEHPIRSRCAAPASGSGRSPGTPDRPPWERSGVDQHAPRPRLIGEQSIFAMDTLFYFGSVYIVASLVFARFLWGNLPLNEKRMSYDCIPLQARPGGAPAIASRASLSPFLAHLGLCLERSGDPRWVCLCGGSSQGQLVLQQRNCSVPARAPLEMTAPLVTLARPPHGATDVRVGLRSPLCRLHGCSKIGAPRPTSLHGESESVPSVAPGGG